MPEEIKENKKELKKEKIFMKEIDSLKEQIAKLEESLKASNEETDKWKNEYYRAYADTKNLRASLEKEHLQAIKYRAEGFIEDLLPVLDSFYMALGNEPSDPALKNYLTGFQYIYKNLVGVLENEGVSEIAPEVNKPFDSNNMNAVDTVEVLDEKQVNLINKVYAKGYKLHDRLIRPAMVTVTKLKEEKADEEKVNENQDA